MSITAWLLLVVAVAVICYVLGRVDGYLQRAAEDRARLLSAIAKAEGKA